MISGVALPMVHMQPTHFLHTRHTLPHDYAIIYKNKLFFLYMYIGFIDCS